MLSFIVSSSRYQKIILTTWTKLVDNKPWESIFGAPYEHALSETVDSILLTRWLLRRHLFLWRALLWLRHKHELSSPLHCALNRIRRVAAEQVFGLHWVTAVVSNVWKSIQWPYLPTDTHRFLWFGANSQVFRSSIKGEVAGSRSWSWRWTAWIQQPACGQVVNKA